MNSTDSEQEMSESKSFLTQLILSLPIFWRIAITVFAFIFISVIISIVILPVSTAITQGRAVSISLSDGIKISEDVQTRVGLERIRSMLEESIIKFQNQLAEQEKYTNEKGAEYVAMTKSDWSKAAKVEGPIWEDAKKRLSEQDSVISDRIKALTDFKNTTWQWCK